jgi:nicotinamidase-related amidase
MFFAVSSLSYIFAPDQYFLPPSYPCRDAVPLINNKLLKLPFKQKIATSDFHSRDNVSLASQHPGKEPFESFHTIYNPKAPNKDDQGDPEYRIINIWPDRCVEGTRGADFIPELSTILKRLTRTTLDKGFTRGTEVLASSAVF